MLTTILALALAAGATFVPAAPLCQVVADTVPVYWVTPPGSQPWRYFEVATTDACPPGGEARVRVTNYGGRFPSAPVIIKKGTKIKFGPLPPIRRLEELEPGGLYVDVPLGPRERRERSPGAP